MGHIHNVKDSDNHFTINPITRAIKGDSTRKTTLIQHDHNSERFSFDLPRYIDGHDMLLCDVVQVHYINVDAATKEQRTGLYEVTDLKQLAGAADMLTCSWLISNHATGLVGSLYFLLRFCCTEGGAVTYAWNTAICDAIAVSAGIDNGEAVAETYPDIIAEWRAELFEAGGDAAHNVQVAQAAALAAIEEAGQNIVNTGENVRAGLVAVLANAVKGKLSGEIVTADDVSPIPAEMAVSIRGKNVLPDSVKDLSNWEEQTDTAQYYYPLTFPSSGEYTISAVVDTNADKYFYLQKSNDGWHSSTTIYIVTHAGNQFPRTFTVEDGWQYRFFWYGVNYAGIQNLQIEAGAAATEYTPYIPPESVKVRACGKNLLPYPYHNTTLTVNGATYTDIGGGAIGLSGTPTEYGSMTFYKGAPLANTGKIVVSGLQAAKNVLLTFNIQYGENVTESLEISSEMVINLDDYPDMKQWDFGIKRWANDTPISGTVYPQIEIGETATEYEPYTGASYPAAADGSVPGVLSVAPNMTLLTDTPGVTIDCEYNRDTNKVIEKLVQAVEALGGSV